MQERFELFTVLINKISRNIRKIKSQEMADYQLKSPHVSCLYYLYISEGLTATDLCERCAEDKATISRALDYLESNGYITCQSKCAKRYKSPLLLTDKGVETARIITEKVDRVFAEIGEKLSEQERQTFYRSLAIISSCMEDISLRTIK